MQDRPFALAAGAPCLYPMTVDTPGLRNTKRQSYAAPPAPLLEWTGARAGRNSTAQEPQPYGRWRIPRIFPTESATERTRPARTPPAPMTPVPAAVATAKANPQGSSRTRAARVQASPATLERRGPLNARMRNGYRLAFLP